MTEDPTNPRQALEASLTALLLGELPPDQSAFLRQAIATDPELARMYARLERTINLVRQTAAEPAPSHATHHEPLKLSGERREQLLQRFKTVSHPALAKPQRKRMSWVIPTAIAASLALLVGALALSDLSKARFTSGETEELRALKPRVKAVNAPTEIAEAHSQQFTPGLNRNGRWPTDSWVAAPASSKGSEAAGHYIVAGQAGAPSTVASAPPQTTIFLPSQLPESESQLALTAKALEGSFSGGGIGGGGGAGAMPNSPRNEPALAEPNQSVSSYGIASEDRSKMRYALAGEAAAARAGAPLPTEVKPRFGGRSSDWAPGDVKDRLPAAGTEIYRGISVMTNGRIEMQPMPRETAQWQAGNSLPADSNGATFNWAYAGPALRATAPTEPTTGLPNTLSDEKRARATEEPSMFSRGTSNPAGAFPNAADVGGIRQPVWSDKEHQKNGGVIKVDGANQLADNHALSLDSADSNRAGATAGEPIFGDMPSLGTSFKEVPAQQKEEITVPDVNESIMRKALRGPSEAAKEYVKVVPAANAGQVGLPISTNMPAATDLGLQQADTLTSVDPATGLPLPQRNAGGPLVTRVIKVNPATFKQGLEGAIGFDWGSIAQAGDGGGLGGGGRPGQGGLGGGTLAVPHVNVVGGTGAAPGLKGDVGGIRGGAISGLQRTNDQAYLQELTRQYFLTMGLDLSASSGQSLFYDDRAGTLVVRARPADLDTIQQAVTVVQSPPDIAGSQSNSITAGLKGYYEDSGSKLTPSELVQAGKLLFEEGRVADAELKLNEAAKKDPQNQAAYYYLNLISEAKFQEALNKRDQASRNGLVEIEKAWATPPQPNVYARTNLLAQNRGKESINSKLNRIRLDSARFENLPLREVAARLSEEARKRDPEKRGVNFLINEEQKAAGLQGVQPVSPVTGLPLNTKPVVMGDVAVNLPAELKDVTLEQLLDTVVKTADRPIKYSVENYGVVFSPATPAPTQDQTARKPAATTPPPEPQPEIQTRDNAFSTFSLNVSDVSFKLAAASLEKGVLPEPASIRSEEFINAFDYRDPEPAPGAPIAFAWERARYPFAQNRDLLRFSLKTAALGRQAGRPLNLVLLLDNSGSMERADRVSIIHEALRVLATQLQPNDTLSVVLFARTPRLWVDGAPGNQAGKVADDLSGLTPEGGTNLGDALDLAYQTALRHYLMAGINRVVLLTDGAANLGNVEPEELKKKVEANRKQGVALDCFGIGWEGYNDDLLEVLTRNGDGRYGFINTPEEAATEFAGQLAGALHVAASDVKVQVEFNRNRVTAYRQIGYAKHQLTKEQFRDNSVDAAELGAAESGNALYVVDVNGGGDGPLATVRVRYKVPGTMQYQEHEWTVPYTGNAAPLEQTSPALRLAASASAFSEWLATSPYAAEVTPDAVLGYLRGVPEIYGADARPKKLEWMLRQAKSLAGKY